MSGTTTTPRLHPRPRSRVNARALASLALMAAALGCSDDDKQGVTSPPVTTAAVTGVSASSKTLTLVAGDDATLTATVTGASGVSQDVVWSSVDAGVARVSASGVVSGVAPGVTEIIVAARADGSKTARVTVTVRARPGGAVQTVEVAPAAVALRAGAELQLAASTQPAAEAGAVDWTSSNASIASVDGSGRVRAAAAGTATIRAAAKSNAQVAVSVPITVVSGSGAVRQLSLTRSRFALNGGQSDRLTAAVVSSGGDAGVTYRSADESVATVDAAGVITARGKGVAEIVVAAAADPTMNVSAFVTVGDARAAAITIQSVTQDNFEQPASLVDARGQLEATVNLDPGDQLVSRVELVMLAGESGGAETIVATQEFTAAAAAALRSASVARAVDQAVAAKAAGGASFSREVGAALAASAATGIAPISLTFNSAAYDPGTGAVRHRNGAHRLRARVVVQGGTPLGTASNTVALNLNNRDGFYVTMRNLSSTGTSAARDANGLEWVQAGAGLEVRTVPVMYSGLGVSRRTIQFPGVGGAPPRVFTFEGGGARTDVLQLGSYQTPREGFAYTDGERPNLSGVDDRGNPLRLVGDPRNPTKQDDPRASDPSLEGGQGGAGIINAQELRRLNANAAIGVRLLGLRIDNVAPTCGRPNLEALPENWANANFNFNAAYSGQGDAGVGASSSARFQFRPSSGGDFRDLPSGAARDIGESQTDFTARAFTGRYVQTDLLGNTNDACPPFQFGVDVTAPTIRYLSSAEQSTIARRPNSDGLGGEPTPVNAAVGADSIYDASTPVFGGVTSQNAVFGIRYTDERSGFSVLPGQGPEFRRIRRLAPSQANIALPEESCALGGPACSFVQALGGIENSPNDTFRRSTVPIFGTLSATTAGYYTYETYVEDRAGNRSPTITKRVAIDIAAPEITGMSIPAELRGNQSATFIPTGTDDLGIYAGDLTLNYRQLGGELVFRRQFFPLLAQPWGAISTPVGPGGRWGQNGLTLAGDFAFIQRIERVGANDAPQAGAQADVKPVSATARLWDIKDFRRPQPLGNAASANFDRLLTGIIEDRRAGVANRTFDFNELPGIDEGRRQVGTWRVLDASASSQVVTVRVTAPTVVINSPFQRVLLARRNSAGQWEVLAVQPTSPQPTANDQGATRFWTYTFTVTTSSWRPDLTTNPGRDDGQRLLASGDQLVAIGVTTEGNGLASQPFTIGGGGSLAASRSGR